MRTHIYVDGFNLYYGALKDTPYKWLDLSALFHNILLSHHQIQTIKYFTANVRNRPNDPDKSARQNVYHRALKAHIPEIEIIRGFFRSRNKPMPLATPPNRIVRVIKTEEKGSDVNLAVHLLNDAWKDEYDCAVVVSNDSDLATAMYMVRRERRKVVGLLTPWNPQRDPDELSYDLKQHANFQRYIRNVNLASSQLPDNIPDTNISKPRLWISHDG